MGQITKFCKKINNDIAKKIIKWRWLSAQDGLVDLETLKKFYLKNNNWPKKNKIKEKIESKISINNHKIEMLWFQDNPPESGIGKIKLAEMLIKNNFKNEGHWLLNEVWKNNTFSYSEEKYILNNFNKIITSTSNSYRIEELIWNKAWGSARRQLKRVNNDIRLLSAAKLNYLEEKEM